MSSQLSNISFHKRESIAIPFVPAAEDFEPVLGQEKDLETIVELVNNAYWDLQQEFFIPSKESRERTTLNELREIVNDPHKQLFVLIDKVKKAMVGTILLEIEEDHAKFGQFAIAREYRKKKLGHILIDHVEKRAVQEGRNIMKIEVFHFAQHLAAHYQQLGYVFTGKTEPFRHSNCVKLEYRDANNKYLREMEKHLI